MNTLAGRLALFALLFGLKVANAQLAAVDDGALVNDPTDKVTWLSDANLFATQAVGSGDPKAFVQAIIEASGGVVRDTPNRLDTPPNSGKHALTMSDFFHNGVIDGHLTWFGARAWVNYLNVTDYEGYTNWRLPTTMDINSNVGFPNGAAGNPPVSSSELAELFYRQIGQVAGQPIATRHNSRYALFHNVGSSYWAGTEAAHATLPFYSAWTFVDSSGRQQQSAKASYNQALSVRSGQAFPCYTTYNGTFHGNVNVSSGHICVVNATVVGNVQQAGGALRVVGSIIAGNVQISGNGQFTIGPGAIIRNDLQIQNLPGGSIHNQICDATVGGNLQFHNNGTAVDIGSASAGCVGNIIHGDLQVQSNTAATALFDNIVIGNLQDQDNAGATRVFDNFVEHNLQCQSNAAISGGGNSAKQKQGQCTDF